MTPKQCQQVRRRVMQELRVERERRGLSRSDLAFLGGPSVDCTQGIEQARGGPTLLTAIAYAAALGWEVQLVKRVPVLGKVR